MLMFHKKQWSGGAASTGGFRIRACSKTRPCYRTQAEKAFKPGTTACRLRHRVHQGVPLHACSARLT
jgi:hypothetical protein